MVCARFAFSNCATYLCALLPIRIHQPHRATQDTNDCETTLAVAAHHSYFTVLAFACASYCIRQFLERICASRDSRHNFRLHILGIFALDCAYPRKFSSGLKLILGHSDARVRGTAYGDLLLEGVFDLAGLLPNW